MGFKVKLGESRSAPGNDARSARIAADSRQAARFIADMTLELRNIANRAELALLTQLLEMAFLEALEVSSRTPAPNRQLKPAATGE